MAKELDKLLSDYKKLKPKLKTYGEKEAEALKKGLLAELKSAWDKEDALRDAIAKAKAEGHEGDKPADFARFAPFAIALSAWTRACKQHRAQVKALESFGNEARKLHAGLAKQSTAAEKEIRRSRTDAKTGKQQAADMKEMQAVLAALKRSADIFGTLKVEEVFYALRQKETLAKIIADAGKKEKGADGASAKLLAEGARRKSLQTAERIGKAINDLCDAAEEQAENPRQAQQALKKAKGHLDKLEKLNDSYQELKKKESKRIAASKEKKFILDMIDRLDSAFEGARERLTDTAKAVKAG